MLNLCPNCNLVSFGKHGWKYINRYNHNKICVCCHHAIDSYLVKQAPEWWLNVQGKNHDQWLLVHTRKGVEY